MSEKRAEREARAQRLKSARMDAGLASAPAAARAFGWKIETYKAHESGRNGFDNDAGREYARAFGVDLAWLMTGVSTPKAPHPMPGDVRIGDDEFSLVSLYRINIGAGAGLVPTSEERDGGLAFSRRWLIGHGIAADLAGLVRVRGDSMSPAIPDGALVLVNCAEMFVEREGVFAFSRAGEAYIKRLIPVERGADGRPRSMVIVSDNTEYPPEVVAGPALNELRVVGRVRCVLTEL